MSDADTTTETKADEPEKPVYGDVFEITVGGKLWKLGRVGYGLRLDAADEIRKQRRLEFKNVLEAVAGLSGPSRDSAVMTAFENLLRNVSVSMHEIAAWQGSPDGEVYQLWKALRKVDATVTRDAAIELYDQLTPSQLADCQTFMVYKLMGE